MSPNRNLVVVWCPDVDRGARNHDLIDYPGRVVENPPEAALLRQAARRVSIDMEIEPGACFNGPIVATGDPGGDINMPSSYAVKGPVRIMPLGSSSCVR